MVEQSAKTMRAIVCDGYGGAEVLKIGERPIPELSQGDILIKVSFTAFNRADIMQRKGNYPPPPGVTDVLGLECLGQIVEDPSKAGTAEEKLGKTVIALIPGGGYAQYAKAKASHTLEVPEGYPINEAAALMEVFCTAYQILFLVSKAEAGEYVLVHAAASGVGTSIIQLAKSAGIKTIAVASNNEKLNYCKEKLGADFTINYKQTPDYQDKVLEFTEGKGANVIADPVGA